MFAAVGLGVAAMLLWLAPAAAASDAPAVPQSVGMLPAADAPPPERGSALPTVLEATGAVLLASGGLIAARSWVSTAHTV